MAVVQNLYTVDLNKPVLTRQMPGFVYTGDNLANRIGCEVLRDGQPADLTGESAIASFILPDATTLENIAGSVEGNLVTVVLPPNVYAKAGRVTMALRLVSGEVKTVVLAGQFTVSATATTTAVVPTSALPTVETITSLIDQLEAEMDSLAAQAEAEMDALEELATAAADAADAAATNANAAAQRISVPYEYSSRKVSQKLYLDTPSGIVKSINQYRSVLLPIVSGLTYTISCGELASIKRAGTFTTTPATGMTPTVFVGAATASADAISITAGGSDTCLLVQLLTNSDTSVTFAQL